MHCFEGHHVTTLGEITNNCGSHHVQVQIQQLPCWLLIFFHCIWIMSLLSEGGSGSGSCFKLCWDQCCGSGSAYILVGWIRIRIQEGQNDSQKWRKFTFQFYCKDLPFLQRKSSLHKLLFRTGKAYLSMAIWIHSCVDFCKRRVTDIFFHFNFSLIENFWPFSPMLRPNS